MKYHFTHTSVAKIINKRQTITSVDEGEENELIFRFDELAGATVLGKNKLNLYIKNKTYQFKGNESFCALKYVNLFYRYKNITGGEENAKFLGL